MGMVPIFACPVKMLPCLSGEFIPKELIAADKREVVSQVGGNTARSDALIEGRTH